VRAVRSDFSEDEVKAGVVLRLGERSDPLALMNHCVANIASFEVSGYLEFLDELPKSPVGRILTFQLRDRGVTAQTEYRPVNAVKGR
jgi:crotonobetaine/carnitine-CoA ligase